MANNLEVFRKGMEKARAMVMRKVADKLLDAGRKLIEVAWEQKEFLGFTGNTQTSISIGVYVDGKLTAFQNGLRNERPPIGRKIQYGKRRYLRTPYEGKSRAVVGKVPLNEEYGWESSMRFLMNYRPSHTKGVGLVMVVGTEYAEYINSGALGPLTSAYKVAPQVVWKEMKAGMEV